MEIRNRTHAAIPRSLSKPRCLLLADIFENFRQTCVLVNGLDPVYYCYTLAGLTFDAYLKFTEQELDLYTDSEMLLVIENAIRGGVIVLSHRCAKANNLLVPDCDPTTPIIIYFRRRE